MGVSNGRVFSNALFKARTNRQNAPNTTVFSAASPRLGRVAHPPVLRVPSGQLPSACVATGIDFPLCRGTRCRCSPLPCHPLGLCGCSAASGCRARHPFATALLYLLWRPRLAHACAKLGQTGTQLTGPAVMTCFQSSEASARFEAFLREPNAGRFFCGCCCCCCSDLAAQGFQVARSFPLRPRPAHQG